MKEANTPGSHHKMICPNCGFAADHNYCAQCGQETHLHKETFWGLVIHFIGHYFHYDSKFWKTMKALWFAPGRLSVDYWAGRRARYIPPVSLYIFISAVYFICYFSIHYKHPPERPSSARTALARARQIADSLDNADNARDTVRLGPTTLTYSKDTSDLERHFNRQIKKLGTPEGSNALKAGFNHNFPKIFFFMIPLMGLLLKVSFLRRKSLYFVNHAVFSLHIHSLVFSVLLIEVLNPFYQISTMLSLICFTACLLYFIIAMRKAYNIGWGRAILNTVFVSLTYLFFFGIATLVILALTVYTA